jgi:hypothetical protein
MDSQAERDDRTDRKGDSQMINFKQEELAQELFSVLKNRFPEIGLINVTESPANYSDVWVNITAPQDEDREIELIELAGEKTTDILLDYGYYISIMTRRKTPQTQSLCIA